MILQDNEQDNEEESIEVEDVTVSDSPDKNILIKGLPTIILTLMLKQQFPHIMAGWANLSEPTPMQIIHTVGCSDIDVKAYYSSIYRETSELITKLLNGPVIITIVSLLYKCILHHF